MVHLNSEATQANTNNTPNSNGQGHQWLFQLSNSQSVNNQSDLSAASHHADMHNSLQGSSKETVRNNVQDRYQQDTQSQLHVSMNAQSLPNVAQQSLVEQDIPVLLITGYDQFTLDAAGMLLRDIDERMCMLQYQVRPSDDEMGYGIARTLYSCTHQEAATALFGEETQIAMDECCITCTVKRDIEALLFHNSCIAAMNPSRVLIVLPVGVEGQAIAQYIGDAQCLHAGECHPNRIQWATPYIGCAVQLQEFEDSLYEESSLCVYAPSTDEGEGIFEERSLGTVVARLVHEAQVVLTLPFMENTIEDDTDRAQQHVLRMIAAMMQPQTHVVNIMNAITSHNWLTNGRHMFIS